jgi:hypothetical protein
LRKRCSRRRTFLSPTRSGHWANWRRSEASEPGRGPFTNGRSRATRAPIARALASHTRCGTSRACRARRAATEEALRLYERALAVKRKHLGDGHPEVAEFWHELARGRLAHGDVNGALEALHTGVNIFRETLPADSPQLAGGLFLLGDVLHLNDHPSDALPYLEEAHTIWRKKPPPNPKDLSESRDGAHRDQRLALRTRRARRRRPSRIVVVPPSGANRGDIETRGASAVAQKNPVLPIPVATGTVRRYTENTLQPS